MELIGKYARRVLADCERAMKADGNEAPDASEDRDDFWESRSRSGARSSEVIGSLVLRSTALIPANDNGRAHHGRHPRVCHGE